MMEAPYDRWVRLAHATDMDEPEFKVYCFPKYVSDKISQDVFTVISFCMMQSDIHGNSPEYAEVFREEMDYAIRWKGEAIHKSLEMKVPMQ